MLSFSLCPSLLSFIHIIIFLEATKIYIYVYIYLHVCTEFVFMLRTPKYVFYCFYFILYFHFVDDICACELCKCYLVPFAVCSM